MSQPTQREARKAWKARMDELSATIFNNVDAATGEVAA